MLGSLLVALHLRQFGQTLDPVVFVVDVVRDVFEILHVSLNEESPEEGEVRMFRVLNFNETPRKLPAANPFAGNLHHVSAADDGERDRGLQRGVRGLEVVVFVGIAVGELVRLDVVLLDLAVDPLFQLLQLE